MLLALVDANYKFQYVDVGCNGRISDGGVFRNSTLSTALSENRLNIPPSRLIGNGEFNLPYTIVADDAFPLRSYIMKPYPSRNLSRDKRIFNYRLSRARRVVENAFGILANRFRVLLSPIALSPETTEKLILTCCVLHNYLITKSARYSHPESFDREMENGCILPGEWRDTSTTLPTLNSRGSNSYSRDAKEIRDSYREYFNTLGQVSWQEKII